MIILNRLCSNLDRSIALLPPPSNQKLQENYMIINCTRPKIQKTGTVVRKKKKKKKKKTISMPILRDNWQGIAKRRSINGSDKRGRGRLLSAIERDARFSKSRALRQIAVDWRNHGATGPKLKRRRTQCPIKLRFGQVAIRSFHLHIFFRLPSPRSSFLFLLFLPFIHFSFSLSLSLFLSHARLAFFCSVSTMTCSFRSFC